jgi:hypothetical protein
VLLMTCPHCGAKNQNRASVPPRCAECGGSLNSRIESGKDRLRRANKTEKHGMRQLGGRLTPASGATKYSKGDGTTSERGSHPSGFRVEFKSTVRASYALKPEEMRKLRKAVQGDEMPVFVVEFSGDVRETFYVFHERDAQYLMELRSESNRNPDD